MEERPATTHSEEPQVGESARSVLVDTVYEPVILEPRATAVIPYRCPAIRVAPGPSGASQAFFPLSAQELGEIWSTPGQIDAWECVPLEGGWARTELLFLPLVTYPMELLRALLDVFRHQQYSNRTPLGWRTWHDACRRPSQLLLVPSSCSRCATPRFFTPRSLLTAPPRLPQWECGALGVSCHHPSPEILYEVSAFQWQTCVSPATGAVRPVHPVRPVEMGTRQETSEEAAEHFGIGREEDLLGGISTYLL